MIGNLTFSIRIDCFLWIYIFYFLFGKLARHSLNSLYVKEHEYLILCSFQMSYASLHIVKSNTYHVPMKSTSRQNLVVILNFWAKLFHIFFIGYNLYLQMINLFWMLRWNNCCKNRALDGTTRILNAYSKP